MNRFLSPILVPVVCVVFSGLGCGSGGGRQLQSIAIHSTANAQLIQFTATGTFSAPPTTVDPLPVNWSFGLFAPPPQNFQYALSGQPYVLHCTAGGVNGRAQISAFAPRDPSAPMAGTMPFTQGVTAATAFTCP